MFYTSKYPISRGSAVNLDHIVEIIYVAGSTNIILITQNESYPGGSLMIICPSEMDAIQL